MIKREQILMLCVGILLISCVYLLWKNKQLSKRIDTSQPITKKIEPDVKVEEEDYLELDLEQDKEIEQKLDEVAIDDYIVEEDIPGDLQKEIDDLNLDESVVTNQEEMIEEIIIDQRPEDDDLTRLEMEIKQKLEDQIEVPDLLNAVPDVNVDIPNAEEVTYTEDMLNNMNLKKLTDICRNKKLKLKGKKSELIDRIIKAN